MLSVLILERSNLIVCQLKNVFLELGLNPKNINVCKSERDLNKISHMEYHIVICDFYFDEKSSALDVFSFLYENGNISNNTRKIVISVEPSMNILDKCICAKVDDFIIKPFNNCFLRTRLLRHISTFDQLCFVNE